MMSPPSLGLATARDDEPTLAPLARASAREGLVSLAERLLELRAWLGDDLAQLETQLVELETHTPFAAERPLHFARAATRQATEHLLRLPGKRIRPLCVLVAARLGGREMDRRVRDIAVACELVHAATLLHDDVVDDGDERRGAPAARVLFGNAASVLGGDHLLVEALRLVAGHHADHLLSELLRITARMVAAEALQLDRRGQLVSDRAGYLEVIHGKTAALFGWGLWAGGQLGGLSRTQCDHLTTIGHHLGTAFQLVDDVLDLEGEPNKTGKETLRDVLEGKLTWPLLLTLECRPHVASLLKRMLKLPMSKRFAATQQLVEEVRKADALTQTLTFAREQADSALKLLANLPAGRPRDALGYVVESAVFRSH